MRCPTAAPRPLAWATLALWAATSAGSAPLAHAQSLPPEGLVRGHLVGDSRLGFRHQPPAGETPTAFERIQLIEYPASDDFPLGPELPFLLRLADGGTLSGHLESLDATRLLLKTNDNLTLAIDRHGLGNIQRRQIALPVFLDRFERIEPTRWQTEGTVEIDPDPDASSRLILDGPGAALRLRPFDPVHAGRVSVVYGDSAEQIDAFRWSIELRFDRPGSEPAFLRVFPGWQDPTLAVEATRGPWLQVRPIPRTPGPHTLVIRFDSHATAITVDGRELAHGDSPGESLTGLVLSVETARAGDRIPPAVTITEVSLDRDPARPSTGPIEPSLDAITRNGGDQLYGRILDADPARLRFDPRLGAEPVELPWSDVASIELKREPPNPAPPLSGLWVRLAWAAHEFPDPRQLDRAEGVLLQADADKILVSIPYLGKLAVPSARLRTLELLGTSRRQIIDPHPHHLGDRTVADLDPPDAEGDSLDRHFQLESIPLGPAQLVLDTVQLIGLNGTPTYSELVRRGELRTRVTLNGVSLPDLNTALDLPNDQPHRLRLPIPAELLRLGDNRLRFEQSGSADDPSQRDDFGFRRLALEWPVPDREP